MRNYTYLLALLLCLSFTLDAQESLHRYWNLDGQPISKTEQRMIFDQDRGNIISVAIDSVDWVEHRLVPRWEKGQLSAEQNQALKNYLNHQREAPLPGKYQAAVIFYPGKDRSNSTGLATRNSYARLYDRFEKKLKRLKTAYPFYIYKNKEGLERQSKDRDWRKDADQLIEQTFFKFHYPGGSYVVVDEQGHFSAFYGEYMISSVIETARKMKTKN
ncbi:MAG: hypothetical protein ACI81P_000279 [Neolewinella sp.]|jgi:hypothetical protein